MSNILHRTLLFSALDQGCKKAVGDDPGDLPVGTGFQEAFRCPLYRGRATSNRFGQSVRRESADPMSGSCNDLGKARGVGSPVTEDLNSRWMLRSGTEPQLLGRWM